MFNARSGVTFAATTEQPMCNDKLKMFNPLDQEIVVSCTLVHGHRQKRHYFTGELPDRDGPVEMFWPKKRTTRPSMGDSQNYMSDKE